MSTSPALEQLSPNPSPSLSASLPRSPPRDTPSTPAPASGYTPHVPPTPPDSSSRAVINAASPPPGYSSPNTSSALSLSSALSAAAPQFQSRLLDTPIDIHELAPGLESPAVSSESAVSAGCDSTSAYRMREQDSPTPLQEGNLRKSSFDAVLPPAFVPAAARAQSERGAAEAPVAPSASQSTVSHPPNVYINGLPPNFPEEDLLAMTRPFGNVLSVRTFTRHVSDKPSGYGFVLFETLEGAEQCIESLRKYRNLHPSFSKQVHKIPGTAYASAPSACSTGPVDSFKAKMEQLRDTASTNLYMEGLPMSITEETLRALVTPYRIMSSRFFPTRLSSPPRIIAFVRLESREAAEEIIERLHGRLVRGSNDAGCRISVRFADTAEQRELRRNERHTREDEHSPARLTMARAALLNLKGTQHRPDVGSPTLGNLDATGLQPPISPNLGLALNNLGLGQLGASLSSAFVTNPSPLQAQGAFTGPMGSSLTSLVGGTPTLDTLSAQAAHVAAPDLRLPQHALNGAGNMLDDQTQLQFALMSMQGLRNASQQGYTPVEQLILQAHARQRGNAFRTKPEERHRPLQDGHVGPHQGMRTSNARDINRRLLNCLPQMSEDDFHAAASLLQDQETMTTFPRNVDREALSSTHRDAHPVSLAHDLERQLSIASQQTRQRNHTLATQMRGEAGDQGLRARSSTHPSQYINQNQAFSHPSNSAYDSASFRHAVPLMNNRQLPTDIISTPCVTSTSQKHIPYSPSTIINAPRHTNINNLSKKPQADTHTLFTSKSNINLPSAGSRPNQKEVTRGASVKPAPPSPQPVQAFVPQSSGTRNGSAAKAHAGGFPRDVRENGNVRDADGDDESSSVVSPALTYSTRTPASLSPSTPYSGFFSEGGETFKGATLCVGPLGEGVDPLRVNKDVGEKQEKHAATGGLNQ
ncbi:hypothetical protein BV20DRAFT_965377 [Pilatotrama ljubarskyi]|nr:hypothetical protein BV20DRAFT_965377 [Pilatotrama ljubarskyi]